MGPRRDVALFSSRLVISHSPFRQNPQTCEMELNIR